MKAKQQLALYEKRERLEVIIDFLGLMEQQALSHTRPLLDERLSSSEEGSDGESEGSNEEFKGIHDY